MKFTGSDKPAVLINNLSIFQGSWAILSPEADKPGDT